MYSIKKSNFKTVILIFWLLLFSFVGKAQRGQQLLVFFKNERFEEAYIEKLLQNLNQSKRPDQLLFDKVLNLNDLAALSADQTILRDLLEQYSDAPANFELRPEAKTLNKQIKASLLAVNYYLTISIGETETLWDFQFALFQTIPGKEDTENDAGNLPFFIVNKGVKKSSCTLDATQKNLRLLENAIKQLFDAAHQSPTGIIDLVQRPYSPDQIYFFALGDTVILDGRRSNDPDSRPGEFNYRWRQIDYNQPLKMTKGVDPATLEIFPNKEGRYKIGLIINDGVTNSKEDTVSLTFINTPQTLLNKKEYRTEPRVSLFQYFVHKNNYKVKIQDSVLVSLDNKDLTDFKLRVTKIRSPNSISKKPITPTENSVDPHHFRLNFSGNLKEKDLYAYQISGNYKGVDSKPATYLVRRPRLEPFKLEIGFEVFAGPEILGIPDDSIGLVRSPFIANAGIYLLHSSKPSAAILIEMGFLFPGKGLGNFLEIGVKNSLKFRIPYAYLSLHYLFVLYDTEYISGNHNYFGFGFGSFIEKYDLEIDLLNVYCDFGNKDFSLSAGIRFNVASLVYKDRIDRVLGL